MPTCRWRHYLAGLIAACCCGTTTLQADDLVQSTISIGRNEYQVRLPPGYLLEIINRDLERPRLMSFARNGDLFIGARSGNIYQLAPPYDKVTRRIDFGGYPHSVAFRYRGEQVEMFVAETEGLYRASYTSDDFTPKRKDFEKIVPLPGGGSHSSRTVGVAPDQRVYLALGISGNCSDEYLGPGYDFRHQRGGVFVLDETATRAVLKPFATGLRNPVGFAWQADAMYASNNGPDHLGFDEPREYFSKLEAGSFHGMPWFQLINDKIERDDCIKNRPPRPREDVSRPLATFDARSAPMGVGFVADDALDKRYRGDAIVALHGSWGTQPSGGFLGDPASRRHPKLVRVDFDNGEVVGVKDFVTGFQLANGSRWARPLGVLTGPDGALYFTSDDGAEGLYRLRRKTVSAEP